jgi:Tol biopolymer transport system component
MMTPNTRLMVSGYISTPIGLFYSSIPGHAQLFRMLRDGSSIQQLTFDDRVNWFRHISPDGKTLVDMS